MHAFNDKRFVGFSLILLLLGFSVIVTASRQSQSDRAKASQGQLQTYTGSGTSGRNPSQRTNNIHANAMIPIPKVDTYPIPPLEREDILNYILGGTKGGTATAGVQNSTSYMVPNSRMPTAGENEYDGSVALIYYYQIKAHIAYTDVVFNFEDGDKVKDIVDNISSGSAVQLRTPEADTLLKVAVTYKGDLCGFGEYNNPGMKQLILKWGRPDLANELGVGETDIESIGLVAQAIDEEPDQEKRREWLAEIYVFYDNINPRSPSGAVPQLREYQCAIDINADGTFDRLVDNYVKGIKTTNLINPTPGGLGYPLLAPLVTTPVTPTFSPLGGGSPTTAATPTHEPTDIQDEPTVTPVVVVATATPAPQAPAPADGGLLGLIIQLILGLILAIFGSR